MKRATFSQFKTPLFLLLFLMLPTCALKAEDTKKKKRADEANSIVKLNADDSNSATGSKRLAKKQMNTRERVKKTIEFANKKEQKRKRKVTARIVRMYQQKSDEHGKLRLLNPRQKSGAMTTKVLKRKQNRKPRFRVNLPFQDGETAINGMKKSRK